MTLEFLVTALVVVLVPGTGVILTIATGLARGARASIMAAIGCTIGIIPHMLAAITGLAAILHTSALAFEIVKYLGVAYLLWMAFQTWREHGALRVEAADAPPRSYGRTIVSAILVNVLNPKLSIFFLAFLPQFVPAGEPGALLLMLQLSLVFMAMTFLVFVVYGIFAAAIRRHVVARPVVMAWMRRTFAATFVLLGARLALSQR